MKIVDVETFAVNVPHKVPFKAAYGTYYGCEYLIVKIRTDNGVVGVGESSTIPIYGAESLESSKFIVERYLRFAVIDQDPFDLAKIHARMNEAVFGNAYAKGGIDLALFDIAGKSLNVPVYTLLGGKYRQEVEVTGVLSNKRPEEMVLEAQRYLRDGFKCLKMKVGVDPEMDLARLKAVRQSVEDTPIKLDANEGWTAQTAPGIIRKMEKYDPLYVEQPIPRWDLNGLADVSKSVETPIVADECVGDEHDAMKIVEKRAADYLNIKIARVGGLYRAKKIATVAEAAGIPCILGSMLELGVGTAAGIHFAVSTENLRYATEIVGPLYIVEDIVKNPLVFKNGLVEVPSTPGLGVDLDENKISKLLAKL